jgi:hypothetical protein
MVATASAGHAGHPACVGACRQAGRERSPASRCDSPQRLCSRAARSSARACLAPRGSRLRSSSLYAPGPLSLSSSTRRATPGRLGWAHEEVPPWGAAPKRSSAATKIPSMPAPTLPVIVAPIAPSGHPASPLCLCARCPSFAHLLGPVARSLRTVRPPFTRPWPCDPRPRAEARPGYRSLQTLDCETVVRCTTRAPSFSSTSSPLHLRSAHHLPFAPAGPGCHALETFHQKPLRGARIEHSLSQPPRLSRLPRLPRLPRLHLWIAALVHITLPLPWTHQGRAFLPFAQHRSTHPRSPTLIASCCTRTA